MRFWDSSAILPLIVREQGSVLIANLLATDLRLALWWGTAVECASALARSVREGRIDAAAHRLAQDRLTVLQSGAREVQPVEEVRHRALRLVDLYPLRAADALQLGAALYWCQNRPAGASFVCLDDRLRAAASREGFIVLPA
jgi:hypothetical protein